MTLEDISLKRGALSHKPEIFAASLKTYCKYNDCTTVYLFGDVETRISREITWKPFEPTNLKGPTTLLA